MSEPQDDIVDRMLAVVDAMTASQRHEAAITYTLDLSEMYLLRDGTRIMRDRIRELEEYSELILQERHEVVLVLDGVRAYAEDHHDGTEPWTSNILDILDNKGTP